MYIVQIIIVQNTTTIASYYLSKDIIKVKGEFITKQKPENIIVSLQVTEEDNDYKKCFASAFETIGKMADAFENNGINMNSVKTRDLSVEEQYK